MVRSVPVGQVTTGSNVARSPASRSRGSKPSSRRALSWRRPVGHPVAGRDDLADVGRDPEPATEEAGNRRRRAAGSRSGPPGAAVVGRRPGGDRQCLDRAGWARRPGRTTRRVGRVGDGHDPAGQVVDVDEADTNGREREVAKATPVGGHELTAELRVIARTVDLARHRDDDRRAGRRSAPRRPHGPGTWSRRTSSGTRSGCRAGTSRRRPARACCRRR